jgi:hypothetical protein
MSFTSTLPPLRWRHKTPRPDPALRGFRFCFFELIGICKAICQGPALLHHPCVYIGAIGEGAYREDTLVFVESPALACQLLPSNVRPQFTRRRSSAGPCLSFGVGACLIRFGRVDAFQPNASVGYVDCVAVDDPRFADDGCRRRRIPMFVDMETEKTSDKNDADVRAPDPACRPRTRLAIRATARLIVRQSRAQNIHSRLGVNAQCSLLSRLW